MGGIVSLAEPVPVQREEKMLSRPRPRPTRPRRADDTAPGFDAMMTNGPKAPSRDSPRKSTASVSTYTPSGLSSSRKPVESIVVARKAARLAPTERPPHITSQMKTKLVAARSEQAALASREAAKAVPIPKKSSRRRLSPPSDEGTVSPISSIDPENWPLPPSGSPKDSVMRSSSDTQKSQSSHKRMTVTEPNQEEDDASVMIPTSNRAWEAIIEELNSDSDADSFKTASDPEPPEHGSIQIGLARCDQRVQSDNEALRPPPLKTHREKPAERSAIIPPPGPPMAVQKLGAPDTLSRYASLVTLNHSREAGILFQDRRVHFTEPKVLIQITGQPARIPKVPSKEEYKALVARGMREFQEYAAKQDRHMPENSRVPAKSPAPKRPPPAQKSTQPKKSQPLPESKKASKAKPPQKSDPLPKPKPKAKPPRKPEASKEISLRESMKGALGAFKKRTSRVMSFESTPGPKRRSLAILLQPQSVRQSVEDISASVATGRGRPLKRDSRRESRARLQKSQKSAGSVSSSPRTSRFFKRSSGSVRNSALRLSMHNGMPSLPEIAELEGEGPYYELAAFDADGNIPRERSLSPIRIWNNGGATWLAANKRMNETSSTLALVPGVGFGNVSRRRDWAEEYRTAIAS